MMMLAIHCMNIITGADGFFVLTQYSYTNIMRSSHLHRSLNW